MPEEKYSTDELKDKIAEIEGNIGLFEAEMKEYRNKVEEYHEMKADPENKFPVEALDRGIVDLKKNISVFEIQIAKERERIKDYRGMIDILKEKAMQEKIAIAIEESAGE
jgi:predicted  nucleic acid-binding Zn-ribbon protein